MSYRYKVILQHESDGGYSVFVPALPGCASQGETTEEAMTNIREAIDLYIEDLLAEHLPVPADETQLREVEVTA
jgi:predicted RNase H-like HicB family nuclease